MSSWRSNSACILFVQSGNNFCKGRLSWPISPHKAYFLVHPQFTAYITKRRTITVGILITKAFCLYLLHGNILIFCHTGSMFLIEKACYYGVFIYYAYITILEYITLGSFVYVVDMIEKISSSVSGVFSSFAAFSESRIYFDEMDISIICSLSKIDFKKVSSFTLISLISISYRIFSYLFFLKIIPFINSEKTINVYDNLAEENRYKLKLYHKEWKVLFIKDTVQNVYSAVRVVGQRNFYCFVFAVFIGKIRFISFFPGIVFKMQQ